MRAREKLRVGVRRAWMAFSTAIGRPRGFFSPFRYAASVRPTAYPELERLFAAAEPEIARVLDRIDTLATRLAEFQGPAPEPRWDQTWFPRLDGAAAYAIVTEARPRRIIEVGSGHSTRFLAKAAADAGGAEITCIDPAPRAALDGLAVDWRHRLLSEADMSLFSALEPGDVAFFDSSHLLWPGSDVDLALNRILPMLKPGVLVHLHDVFLPDPYPDVWAWRGYTEQTGLGGWLAGGGAAIRFASVYAGTRMAAAARPGVSALPLNAGAWETSLWLTRQ